MSEKASASSAAAAAAAAAASARPAQAHRQRMSFASVAAMAPSRAPISAIGSSNNKTDSPRVLASAPPTNFASEEALLSDRIDSSLAASLTRLEIKDGQVPIPDVPDHELQAPLQLRPRLEDEKTHLSFSSTKAPSLDGKSVASGATFAMDEKESIRPDDSASVMAGEDDDSVSGPASGAPNSRVGSEAGGKAFISQFNEISQGFGPGALRSMPGLAMRRALPGTSEELRRGPIPSPNAMVMPTTGIPRTDPGLPNNLSPPYNYQGPDEKILEALESPKDRLFLLKLEEDVISFIKNSTDPVLNLPPCNSFCRLLAHRLGDYYALGHVVDNSQSAVQLHRTPNCQLRPPLSSFASKLNPTSDLAATLPSMKIMRRAGMGGDDGSGFNTTENSVGPSKAGSEIGDETYRSSGLASPSDSTSTKDKKAVTREEREAKYKMARERIFADWKESEIVEAGQQQEDSNDASRSSSANDRKKKRNIKNNDDGFDSRSAYNAYYPPPQRQQGPAVDPSTSSMYSYNPYMQNNGQMLQPGYQQPYSQPYPQMPLPQMQGYQMPMQPQNQMATSPAIYNQATSQQQYVNYGQQIQTPYYPQMPQQIMAQPPSMPSPALSNHSGQLSRSQPQVPDQSWGQNSYQSPYQVYPTPPSPYQSQAQSQMQSPANGSTVPYPYGQLPYQPNGQSVRPIHPVPGSYSRQNQYGSPGRVPMDPNAFQIPSGYQDASASNAFTPSHITQTSPPQHFTPTFPNQHSSLRKAAGITHPNQLPGQSTLSKWGTPSTLPPKPPPPVSSITAVGSSTGGVPTYQNGTYSKPANSQTEAKVVTEPIAQQ